MIVNSDGHYFLRLFLTDDVFIQIFVDLKSEIKSARDIRYHDVLLPSLVLVVVFVFSI
jgi:hypothetical protein